MRARMRQLPRAPHHQSFGAWRSPVARLVWDQEVESSNLSAPTVHHSLMLIHRHDEPLTDAEWRDFLKTHDFGDFIVPGAPTRDLPVVVPTHFIWDGGKTVLLHLARINPVWKAIEERPRALLSVFGAYAYIPGHWNQDEYGVPTSYYTAVQLACDVEPIDDDAALAKILERQLGHFQPEGKHAPADGLRDVAVGVVVFGHPANDVREGLRRVLDPVDELDLVELDLAARRVDGQLLREVVVQSHVIAKERVRTERDVVDPHEVRAVFEMLHEALDRVLRVLLREGRVRRGLDADHAAFRGERLQHLIGLHTLRVPETTRSGVRCEDRLVARLDRVERGLVARVRDVDGDAELVHAAHRLAAELGKAAVTRFPKPAPERVGLAVRDARRPDPEPVEDVEPVDLVLDRRRRLERRDERDLSVLLRALDVVERLAANDEVLVGDVAHPHPEVIDDVVPLPPGLRGDGRGAVHEAIENGIEARLGHAGVAGEVTTLTAILRKVAEVLGNDETVIVQ